MNVLLTGASGLLGAHLLQQGLQKGWKIKVLTRSIPSRSYLKTIQDQVEIIHADLLADAWPENLLQDVDTIIHAAALVSPRPEDEERMMATNNIASQKLFELAKQKKIQNWVQISTTAVLTGSASEEDLVSEKDFGKLRTTAYARSKFAFDKFLESQQGPTPRVLKIYPGYMLGSWDSTPSSGAVFLQMRWGKLKGYQEGTKNFVAAADVAKGILQALDRKAEGAFILGGHNLKISTFFDLATKALASKPLSAINQDEFASLSSEEQSSIREFCESAAVTSQKALSTFDYEAKTSVEQMIQDTVDSFAEMRLLRKMK